MDVETCHVCNQPLDDVYSVTCTVCHRRVHFQSAEGAAQACSRLHIQLLACGFGVHLRAVLSRGVVSAEGGFSLRVVGDRLVARHGFPWERYFAQPRTRLGPWGTLG